MERAPGAGADEASGASGAVAVLRQAQLAAQSGQVERAQELLLRALDLGADAAEVHYRSGLLHVAAGRLEDAADSFALASHLRNDYYAAWLELSAVYLQLAWNDDALEAARTATSFAQAGAESFNNLGLAARAAGRYEEAERALRSALERKPEFHAARANFGLLLMDLGRTDAAIAQFEAVLADHPDDDEVLWNLAVARLSNGEFRAGWVDYEKRWLHRDALKRRFDFPVWSGDPPGARRVLVYAEQGIGDEIMFASCIPDAVRLGGHWLLECSPRLETLFRRSFPGIDVIAFPADAGEHWRECLRGVDLQVPAGSLPRRLGRDTGTFPGHHGYLCPDPLRVSAWKRRLEKLGPGLKVGVSWRGGDPRTGRRTRSLEMAELAPLLRAPGCRFVSLQYGPVDADCEALRREHAIALPHWSEAQSDFDELAALICALDLVISVTTAVVHLTGAIGKTAWVLVPASPEWRYGRSGERMPWYPSVSLYRQAVPREWSPVIRRVAADLGAFALPRDPAR